ncbi:metaxin 1 [Entomortierella beljakovae]|nr:metaxin 1 [Entomortierella beljakovae]
MANNEEVISTEYGPEEVEYIEEIQDGKKIRKKIIRKKVTTRVASSSSSNSITPSTESGQHTTTTSSTTTSTSSHSSNKQLERHSSSESKDINVIEGSEQAKEISSSRQIQSSGEVAEGYEVSSSKQIQSSEDSNSSVVDESSGSRRTFKYRIFGEGETKDHPLFKFLARFPLKQSPAPHTRPRSVKAVLYAYASGWQTSGDLKQPNIGSFDADSLKWMATDGFECWVQDNKDKDATAELDLHESAEAVAFITLAESKIHAALLYTLWFEPAHFYATTRQHYFGHYKWLLTVLLSYLARSEIANSMLLTRAQIDRELIFEEAATAIESLAVQLGDKNEYFFGKNKPSALDAVVFSYLHVILTLPKIRNADDAGRSGELATIVKKHENLYKYSQNIWKKWFAA